MIRLPDIHYEVSSSHPLHGGVLVGWVEAWEAEWCRQTEGAA